MTVNYPKKPEDEKYVQTFVVNYDELLAQKILTRHKEVQLALPNLEE